jgi:hypothetical protein
MAEIIKMYYENVKMVNFAFQVNEEEVIRMG